MHIFFVYLLVVDGVYSTLCGVCTLLNIPPLNIEHITYWKNEEDNNNKAASRFMGYLFCVLGAMCLASAAGAGIVWACASFLIEGVVFATETLVFETMHTAEGMGVVFASFVLLFCYSFLI